MIPNVKQGRTLLQYSDFFDNIIDGTVFSPVSIPNPFNGNSEEVTVTINVTDTIDYIRFTGWRGNSLVTEDLPFSHGYISQQPTQYRPDINLAYLSRIDVTGNGGLLTWDHLNIFKRHRQIHHRKYVRTGSIGYFESNCEQTIDETIVNDSIDVPSSDSEKGSFDRYIWKEYWDYSQENFRPRTFIAMAHYTGIPAAIQVTTPNNPAAASSNQVVLFENAYYVADNSMKGLVESLVSGVTVIAQKEVIRSAAWTYDEEVIYYKISPYTDTNGNTQTGYFTRRATITFSGISSQVKSAVIPPNTESLTIQLNNYTLLDTGEIRVSMTYNVSDPYTLTNIGRLPSDNRTVNIPNNAWDKKDTYRFFN